MAEQAAAGGARPGRIALAGLGLIVAYTSGRVLEPFICALSGAAIAAVAAMPLYRLALARWPKRPGATAGLLTASLCVAAALPLGFGGWLVAKEASAAFPELKEQVQSVAADPVEAAESLTWLPESVSKELRKHNLKKLFFQNVQQTGQWAAGRLKAAVGGAMTLGVSLLVFILFLFFFLRDGEDIVKSFAAGLPLPQARKERILERTRDMVIATVQGVFVVCTIHGVLAAVGFLLFHVRFPILLGFLCGLLSVLPTIGIGLVWVPVVLFVLAGGAAMKAVLLSLWFLIIVGLSDNVLRPLLMGGRARLSAPVVVIGILGGVEVWGPMGSLMGPVVLAIAAAVLEILYFPPSSPLGKAPAER